MVTRLAGDAAKQVTVATTSRCRTALIVTAVAESSPQR